KMISNKAKYKSLLSASFVDLTGISQSASAATSSSYVSVSAITFMPESSAATSRNISISYLRVYESCDTNTTIIDCSLITELGPWRNQNDDSCIATTFPPVSSSIFSDASRANSLNMPDPK